jgi:hypothetical protein
MGIDMSKKKLFWLIYLFIQLPLAILVIRGLRLNKINNDLEKTIVSFHSVKEGKYALYDYISSIGIGSVTVKNKSNNIDLLVSIEAESVNGRDEMLSKNYNFSSLTIVDFLLERKEYRGEIFWMGQQENINLIIVSIFNDIYHTPIPSSIYSEGRKYFFYSIIDDFYYHYIKGGNSPLPINRIIPNGAAESISSGIFFY